jgi:hypothetical protein
MMGDKKELLDYLRNQQKAAEIEAKINGVNIWVLLGAMAVVSWQLTASPAGRLWNDFELILRTLVASVGLYGLSWFIRGSIAERDELRYSGTIFDDVDSPYLVLIKSVLILLPPAGLVVIAGKSVGTIFLSLLGTIFVVLSIVFILKPLFPASSSKEKFPKPNFGQTKQAGLIFSLLFAALLVVAIAEQFMHLINIQGGVALDDAKQMVLLAVLYQLVLIAVSRKLQNDSIAWTYELETDLILGAISPEVAIRRIENRRLGPRLQDVMNRFFDDLDRRFRALETMLDECTEKMQAANKVPEQYPAERAARVREASARVTDQIDGLIADCEDFKSYLKRLEQKPSAGNRRVLTPILESLKARHELYNDRAQTAKSKLRRLLA